MGIMHLTPLIGVMALFGSVPEEIEQIKQSPHFKFTIKVQNLKRLFLVPATILHPFTLTTLLTQPYKQVNSVNM